MKSGSEQNWSDDPEGVAHEQCRVHRIILFAEESHLRAPPFSRAPLLRPYSTESVIRF